MNGIFFYLKNKKQKIVKLMLLLLFLLFSIALFIIYYQTNEQNKNIDYILANNLDGRLIPHKADRETKVDSILKDGICSLELDMLFYEEGEDIYFAIGHDADGLYGMKFEDYLKKFSKFKMKKIWMDMKNISVANITKVLSRLNYLDRKYNIKKIAIIESQIRNNEFKLISNAGYHTSYYITLKYDDLISNKYDKELKEEAQRIKRQTVNQNLKALSFSSRYYPFVKKYVEPIISKDIVYHTWHSIRLKKQNAMTQLYEKKYFKDKRVKTIIYDYYHVPYITPLFSYFHRINKNSTRK